MFITGVVGDQDLCIKKAWLLEVEHRKYWWTENNSGFFTDTHQLFYTVMPRYHGSHIVKIMTAILPLLRILQLPVYW